MGLVNVFSKRLQLHVFLWYLIKFKRHFQFGYTENHALLSSIAVWELKPPVLFILDTKTFKYALVDVIDARNRMLDIDIDKILNDTRENKLTVLKNLQIYFKNKFFNSFERLNNFKFYSGHSILRTIYRPFWEVWRAIFVRIVIFKIFYLKITFNNS